MFRKIISNRLILGIILTAVLVTPLLISAQANPPSDNEGNNPPSSSDPIIKNPFKQSSIQGLIETLIKDILMPIGGVIAVLMIMYAGFLYVTARGDTTQIKKATEALKYAVIGSAILLGAWVISQAISATIGQLRV